MPEKDQEELFAQVAVELGLMTSEQVQECRRLVQELRAKGLSSRRFSQVCMEKSYLNQEQYKQVLRELRKRGVYPRLGGYELIRKIGAGAMGVVYEGRQISLDRTVALKILDPQLSRDGSYVQRFEREAKLAARLAHPNAVHVYDVGHERGTHYIVMEYVEGQTLDRLLEGGLLDEKRALKIVHDIAKALGEAHGQGIIHRDIKPSNILVRTDGIAKLSDLGIAKELGSATTAALTSTGVAVGTPRYMSPEQCTGEKGIDRRADIYSLGITLYRMVCGKDPFSGPTPLAVIKQHLSTPLPDPKSLNPSLSSETVQLIRDMTSKDRNTRVQSCEEVVGRIEQILTGVTVVAPPSPPPLPEEAVPPPLPTEAGGRSGRKKKLLIGGVIAALVIGAVVLLVMLTSGKSGVQEPPTAITPPGTGQAKPPGPGTQENEEYTKLLIEAVDAEAARDWDKALAAYGRARAMTRDTAQVDRGIERIRTARAQGLVQKEYDESLAKGMELTRQEKWAEAKAAYEKAKAAADQLSSKPPGYQDLLARMEETQAALEGSTERVKLLALYRGELEKGAKLAQQEKWAEAKAAFLSAKAAGVKLDTEPAGYASLAESIAECDKRLAVPTQEQPKPEEKKPEVVAPPEATVKITFSRAEQADRVVISSVAFSPASPVLACGREDGAVNLWDLKTCRLINILSGPENADKQAIEALVFSPDGQLLAGAGPKAVWLWQMASGRSTVIEGGVFSAAFSPNGRLLAAAGYHGKVWDTKTLRLAGDMPGDYTCVAFSGDGRILAAADTHSPSAVELVNLKTLKVVDRIQNGVGPLSCSANGQWLACAIDRTQIALYDLAKRSVSTTPVVNSGGGREEVKSLAFHPRQPLVAAKCADGAVRVYTVPDGKLACAMKQGEARLGRLAFSPDGKYIASCFEGTGRVDLWNMEKTSLALSLVAVGKRGKDVLAWTPEGYYIATPYPESMLTAKLGDKDVPADELKALFHRPEMVAAKLAGKDVPSPSELKKEKTSPKGQD